MVQQWSNQWTVNQKRLFAIGMMVASAVALFNDMPFVNTGH